MQGKLLRLAGPLAARVAPHLGGDVELPAVVPLGKPEGEALGVGSGEAVLIDRLVVLDRDDGFMF